MLINVRVFSIYIYIRKENLVRVIYLFINSFFKGEKQPTSDILTIIKKNTATVFYVRTYIHTYIHTNYIHPAMPPPLDRSIIPLS